MSEATIILMPAALPTKACYDYCGGQPVFEELLEQYPEIIKPLRQTPRGDMTYRRVSIDAALAVAESEGTLIQPLLKPKKVLKKKARRFEQSSLT